MKTLKLSWNKKKANKAVRIGMMYCFKNCEKNQN